MTVCDRRIAVNHYHGKVHCLAGGRKVCLFRPEFVLHFAYTKNVTSKDGVRRLIAITANRPACREHAEKFARKHGLEVPRLKPSR